MKVPEYRTYLHALLTCAFANPRDYLDDSCAPTVAADPPPDAAADRGLLKALRARKPDGKPDSPSWTVEVVLQPGAAGFGLGELARTGWLDEVLLVGATQRDAARLEEILDAASVRVAGKPIPDEGREDVLTARMEQSYQHASKWSQDRQENAWGSP